MKSSFLSNLFAPISEIESWNSHRILFYPLPPPPPAPSLAIWRKITNIVYYFLVFKAFWQFSYLMCTLEQCLQVCYFEKLTLPVLWDRLLTVFVTIAGPELKLGNVNKSWIIQFTTTTTTTTTTSLFRFESAK